MAASLAILRIKDFRLMFLARIFSIMALQAQDVIIGWQVYSITRDPFMLGLAGLTEALPAITCALIAGHIVDMNKPHRILLICLSVISLNMFGLLLIGGGYVHILNHDRIVPFLFFGIFISGVARSFIMPSTFSLVPHVVTRQNLPSASAWFGSGFQIAAITGPAVAGIIYGGYGARVAWFIPFCLTTCALILFFSMSKSTKIYQSTQIRESAIKSIKAGWKFIFQNRMLLSIMALDMFAVLFGGAVAMLPAYADQVLHVGGEGLGILRASPAIGAIVTALFLAIRPFKVIHTKTLLFAILGFGLSIMCFGLSTSFHVSVLCLIASGAFDSISMVVRATLMQLLTPDSMRGRVSSVNSMFIISSNEIGAFESGSMAKLLGLVPSVVFGGMATIIVVASAAIFNPKLKTTVVETK